MEEEEGPAAAGRGAVAAAMAADGLVEVARGSPVQRSAGAAGDGSAGLQPEEVEMEEAGGGEGDGDGAAGAQARLEEGEEEDDEALLAELKALEPELFGGTQREAGGAAVGMQAEEAEERWEAMEEDGGAGEEGLEGVQRGAAHEEGRECRRSRAATPAPSEPGPQPRSGAALPSTQALDAIPEVRHVGSRARVAQAHGDGGRLWVQPACGRSGGVRWSAGSCAVSGSVVRACGPPCALQTMAAAEEGVEEEEDDDDDAELAALAAMDTAQLEASQRLGGAGAGRPHGWEGGGGGGGEEDVGAVSGTEVMEAGAVAATQVLGGEGAMPATQML
jgi:hypothetical protein